MQISVHVMMQKKSKLECTLLHSIVEQVFQPFKKMPEKVKHWVWKFGHYSSIIDKKCLQIIWTYDSLMIFVQYIDILVWSLTLTLLHHVVN